MNVSTQPKLYQGEGPTIYSNSSVMSPDRREFYLSHKSGQRQVVQLPEDVVVAATKDPRFPIDLCCVHRQRELGTFDSKEFDQKQTLVCFSSKMIVVAKIQQLAEDVFKQIAEGVKAGAAAVSVASPCHIFNEETAKLLPRRKGQRSQESYARIPLSPTGEILLNNQNYPSTTKIDPNNSLSTAVWYVWLSIIFETGNTARVARTKVGNSEYFVLQNNYHLILQEL
jgi:hypothetical protein